MKTIKQQNMDLDLRRYGKDVFTKASDSDSEGSVDEQSLVTEALNSIITPPSEGNVIYPDAYIFINESEEYIVLDTVKALASTYMFGIIPAYNTQPTPENIYFRLNSEEIDTATLGESVVNEATIDGVTYYYLTEILT